MSASVEVSRIITEAMNSIEKQMTSVAYRAANELRNASLDVLAGQRSGRVYYVPNTRKKYTASAPGEPPANRTGAFRLSWQKQVETRREGDTFVVTARIHSDTRVGDNLLGELLEGGTSKMAPRPYQEKIKEAAKGPTLSAFENIKP